MFAVLDQPFLDQPFPATQKSFVACVWSCAVLSVRNRESDRHLLIRHGLERFKQALHPNPSVRPITKLPKS